MFTVYDKKTNQQVDVFDVQRDKCGHAQFLVEVENQWLYRSAKHYTSKQKHNNDDGFELMSEVLMCNHDYVTTYDIDENGERVFYDICTKCCHEVRE